MKLEQIIYELIIKNEKGSHKLPRGLVLAFTPQPCDDRPGAGARLVWSRKGKGPSDVEDQIVKDAVMSALYMVRDRVVVDGPMFRVGLVLREGWGSSLSSWRWVGTAELMNLSKADQYSAGQWLQSKKGQQSLAGIRRPKNCEKDKQHNNYQDRLFRAEAE